MNNNVNNKQSMNTDELYLLVATELSDTLTAEETKRLEEWKAAAPANKSLYEKLVRIWEATPDVDSLAVYDREKAFELFLAPKARTTVLGKILMTRLTRKKKRHVRSAL